MGDSVLFQIRKDIAAFLKDTFSISLNFQLSISKVRGCGEIATNIVMLLKNKVEENEGDIVEKCITFLNTRKYVEDVQFVKPGFLNITLTKDTWSEVIKTIIDDTQKYTRLNLYNNDKLNLEFVSVNPTGELHIGHARGAIYGNALANILSKCNYNVVKEYYINDHGSQIDLLIESVWIRYKQLLGEKIELEEDHYPGEYLIPIAQKIKEKYGDKLRKITKEEKVLKLKEFILSEIMNIIKKDLKLLGISHDIFRSEEHDICARGKIEEAMDILKKKGLIYKGKIRLPLSKTKITEEREQLLFKSTEFGDDCDRALTKKDGGYTYFTGDFAYHLDKLQRGFKNLLVILGSDHIGYVKRIKSVVKALDNTANIRVECNQLVNILENSKKRKMSKRKGVYLTIKEMLKLIDKDSLNFIMLTRKHDSIIDIDLKTIKEENKNNHSYYVQYAHARCSSILRTSNKVGKYTFNKEDIELLKMLISYPKVLEEAAENLEPHRITYYLYQLATSLHALWTKGKTDKKLRFSELEGRRALVLAVKNISKEGLNVIGVNAIEKL